VLSQKHIELIQRVVGIPDFLTGAIRALIEARSEKCVDFEVGHLGSAMARSN
jgi:hypothetical protein